MYSDGKVPGRRLDDSYVTRPRSILNMTERSVDLPRIGGTPAAPRAAWRPPRRKASVALYLALTFVLMLLAGAGGGLYYLDRSYQGKIYPNVTVQGLNVGELSPAQAEAVIRQRHQAFIQRPVTLTYGDRTWQPTLADVGVEFDFKIAIKSAYRAGRDNGLCENLQEVYAIWQNGLELPVHVTFDQNRLRQYVAASIGDLEQAPIDAQLRLDGTTVSTQPAHMGRQLMIDVARVPNDNSSDRIAVGLNNYQLYRRVSAIAEATGRGSVNPRVDWNNADLKIIRPGKPGLRMDEDQARAAILAAIGSANRSVVLPIAEVEPQVTEANLRQLGINELIAVGRSDFTGSAEYRIHNIGAGMNILHGILIAPGEEFSFNENIGSIDEKNGFVKGYAIIQNRTQLEFGGGICQDSTTLFRAAFWAGLPITERWGHSFFISWYDKYGLGAQGNGAGLDATIFTGGPDLKFVNDTGNWLLMQTSYNPRTGVAEVALYG